MNEYENVAGGTEQPENEIARTSQENLHEDSTHTVDAPQGESSIITRDSLVNSDDAVNEQADEAENVTPTTDVESSTTDAADAQAEETSAEKSSDTKDTQEIKLENGFDSLGLPKKILDAVKKVGFSTPSPIQEQTIPILLRGQDVVGLAQTGTGKTAAFALPILANIDPKDKSTQALILAPTRELALQVAEAVESFAQNLGITVLPIYGGASYGAQLSGLRRGAQVVVGTPGRVIDHLDRGSLNLSDLRFMVLDEADEMLNMGFQDDVERILEDTPEDKQVALFSATMPSSIRRLSKQYLNNPEEVTIKSTQRTGENITQKYMILTFREKLDALTRLLETTEFDAMIMFVRTKRDTEELADALRERGFNAAAINGDISQDVRERTVDQLKDGRLDILVATDVAARGLDVDRITHVFNYDIPHDTESYVHRIGRTGRAGRSGEAILFVTPRERRLLKAIERATKSDLTEIDLPTADEVNAVRKKKFTDSITESLADPQIEIFKELIEKFAAENDGVDIATIAAAIAAQSKKNEEFLVKDVKRSKRERNEREGRGRDRGERNDAPAAPLKERFKRQAPVTRDPKTGKDFAVYKIAVGKRQGVRPGAIVGAIANEGGLNSRDFGRINIFAESSLIELPTDLPMDVFKKLDKTRVSGKLINIEPDPGAPAGRPASRGGRDGGRGHNNRDGGREFSGRSRGGRDGGRGRDRKRY